MDEDEFDEDELAIDDEDDEETADEVGDEEGLDEETEEDEDEADNGEISIDEVLAESKFVTDDCLYCLLLFAFDWFPHRPPLPLTMLCNKCKLLNLFMITPAAAVLTTPPPFWAFKSFWFSAECVLNWFAERLFVCMLWWWCSLDDDNGDDVDDEGEFGFELVADVDDNDELEALWVGGAAADDDDDDDDDDSILE